MDRDQIQKKICEEVENCSDKDFVDVIEENYDSRPEALELSRLSEEKLNLICDILEIDTDVEEVEEEEE